MVKKQEKLSTPIIRTKRLHLLQRNITQRASWSVQLSIPMIQRVIVQRERQHISKRVRKKTFQLQNIHTKAK